MSAVVARGSWLAWRVGTPVRALLVGAIRVYRATLAGWLGGQCRFHPSCSAYAEEAIRRHGAIRGGALAIWHVLRCNPFGRGGFEPVPAGRRMVGSYVRRPELPREVARGR